MECRYRPKGRWRSKSHCPSGASVSLILGSENPGTSRRAVVCENTRCAHVCEGRTRCASDAHIGLCATSATCTSGARALFDHRHAHRDLSIPETILFELGGDLFAS